MDADDTRGLLTRWARGNVAAVDMLEALYDASHDADDIIDGDAASPVTSMAHCWLKLVAGVLFSRYLEDVRARTTVAAAVQMGVADWWLATQWQGSDDEVRAIYAFVLRETLEHAIIAVAMLEGGPSWGLEVRREISQVFHIAPPQREDFVSWWEGERAKIGLSPRPRVV